MPVVPSQSFTDLAAAAEEARYLADNEYISGQRRTVYLVQDVDTIYVTRYPANRPIMMTCAPQVQNVFIGDLEGAEQKAQEMADVWVKDGKKKRRRKCYLIHIDGVIRVRRFKPKTGKVIKTVWPSRTKRK